MSTITKLSLQKKSAAYTILFLLMVPFALPLVWMLITSLKTDAQIFPSDISGFSGLNLKDFIPNPARFSNYKDALQTAPFGTYLINTLFLCTVSVFGTVLSSSIVAYGFARCQFKGRNLLFILMLATIMLPGQVVMIPQFLMWKTLGAYNTFIPLLAPSFTGGPFYIFLIVQYFKTIPKELSEAARVDGCSEWGIFFKIFLPLSVPVLATCAIFQFIAVWNDFFGPLLYLNDPNKYTLAYGLQQFVGNFGGQWSYLMAAATVFSLPVVVIFFFAQKTFIQGISTTGGK
jgi:multiple sugar transport system permease protein